MLHATTLALPDGQRFEAPVPALFVRVLAGRAFELGSRAECRSALADAGSLRAPLAADSDCFRLVNDAADGLPGVTIDRYGDYAVLAVASEEAETRAGELAADLVALGLAEAMVPSARIDELESSLAEAADAAGIDALLRRFTADPGAASLAPHRAAIDRCFCEPTMERILAALETEGTDWADATAAILRAKSPTSLKVALRQLRLGRTLPDFETAMRLEFRLVQHFMAGGDFFEGVRAVVIDKDQRPRWSPDRLEAVSDAAIDCYFAPLGRELEFPD